MRVLLQLHKNQKRSVYCSAFNFTLFNPCAINLKCDESSLEKGATTGLFSRCPT